MLAATCCKCNHLIARDELLVATGCLLLLLACYYQLQVLPLDYRYFLYTFSMCLLLLLSYCYCLLGNTFCMGYHLFTATAHSFEATYLLVLLACRYHLLLATTFLLLPLASCYVFKMQTTCLQDATS